MSASHSRVIEYYGENCLECGFTYVRERGVVQVPRAIKVDVFLVKIMDYCIINRKRLELLMKSISKIHMSSIMPRGLTGKR